MEVGEKGAGRSRKDKLKDLEKRRQGAESEEFSSVEFNFTFLNILNSTP